MLESDYLTRFTQLISTLSWDIELPRGWENFFQEKGLIPSCVDDERQNQRIKLSTHGVLYCTLPLPSFPRSPNPIGIYTHHFSRKGCCFLADFQMYPQEQVRIVLPTFWARLHVARCRRITSRCYEVGCMLLSSDDPSDEAFEIESRVCGSR